MILITGGAGYIGSHTLKHLLDEGFSCVVVDNLSYGHIEAVDKRAKFIRADISDKNAMNNIFSENKIEAVIHFAGFIAVGESVENPSKYYQNNVAGTLNLLDCMIQNNVKKIVFSSTCATYGEPKYTPLDELHPQNPINPYGKTKLMIEEIFKDYKTAYGLKYIALRYFNASGASSDCSIGESHNPETHLIPLVLRAIKDKKPTKVFGDNYNTPDGTCIRDYIHVEDLAQAHKLALLKLDEFQGFLNIGTGKGTSVKEIIEASKSVSGLDCKIENCAKREGDAAILFADNKKAREILGWQPKYTDIKDIIKTAWAWENAKKF